MKVIEAARLLDENTVSALFHPSLCNHFFWWASLNRASLNHASNCQVLRIVSMVNKPGGFFVKEASVN